MQRIIIFIPFFCLFYSTSSAQNGRLLWYIGKKLSDTSLQTSAGRQVTYSPAKGWLRITGGSKVMEAIADRLKKREQFKQQVIQTITQAPGGRSNIFFANLAAATIDEVDAQIEDQSTGATELVMDAIPHEPTPNARLVPVWVQNYFDEVVNFVITQKSKEKEYPDPPPAAHYDYCFPCDSARKSKYDTDTTAYMQKTFGRHSEMLSKAFKVIRYFEDRKVKGLPYDAAAAERMIEKMQKDAVFIMNDLAEIIMRAWELYKNNANYISLLTRMVIVSNRQFELYGVPLPAGFPGVADVGRQLLATMTRHFDEAYQKRDYPVLLNVAWLTGLLRQASLLYDDIPVSEKLLQFLRASRFEMVVDAEATLGKEGKNMTAKITGANIYRAVPDKDCKLRWHLVEPNEKQMLFTLEKAEMNMGVPASYSGTMEWQTGAANIQLGFCEKPLRDTLIIETFSPKGVERWTVQGQVLAVPYVESIFNNCFMDQKRILAAAADKQLAEKQMKELMAELNKDVKGNEALMQKDPATMTADERQRFAKLVNGSRNIKDITTAAAVLKTVLFKKELQQNLKTVFDGEVDGRILFPKNTSIQHAKFKVKLIHVED